MAYLLPVCSQTPVEFLSKHNESEGEKFPKWAKAPSLRSITSSHVYSSDCCVWASLNPALPLLSPDLIYTLIPASFPHCLSFALPYLSQYLWDDCMPEVVSLEISWPSGRETDLKWRKKKTIMTLESVFLTEFYQVRQKAGASSWFWPVIPLWETFSTQRGPVIQSDIHTSMLLSSLNCTTWLWRLACWGQSGLLCL